MMIVAYAVGFILLLLIAARVAAYLQMRQFSLRTGSIALVGKDDIPGNLRCELEDGVTALLPLGFHARGFARVMTIDADDARPQWTALAQESQDGTWALIAPQQIPEAEVPLLVAFYTPLADGRILMTCEGASHLLLAPYPDTILVEHAGLDVVDGGRLHRNEVRRYRVGMPYANAESLIAMLHRLDDAYLPMLHRQGMAATRPGDGSVRLTASTAWSFAGRIQRWQSARKRALDNVRRRKGHSPPAVPAAIEADAVLRMGQSSEQRSSGGSSPLILGFSVIAFIVTLRLMIGPNASVTMIIAILLFHEYGHLLTMRAFGYRDTRIFFLPMFGAIVSGRKDDATIPQQVLVSLMGPLPGLVLGLVLLCSVLPDRHNFLFQASLLLISINLFNLLPVLPLDGGQIVSRLLGAHWPWLDFVFRVVAVAALIVLGLYSAPPLLFLGGLFALALIHQFKIVRLHTRIRHDPAIVGHAGDSLTETVSALALQDPSLCHAPFLSRMSVVRNISNALRQSAPSLWMTLGLLAAYVGACALVPVVAIVMVIVRIAIHHSHL
jgi:Zn-dependent protease